MPADPVQAMLEAMRASGIEPVDAGVIVVDGALHRFRVEGDKPGTCNGWCVLRPTFGVAGSWKSGTSCTWSSRSASSMSRSEKDSLYRSIRESRAEAQRQREAEQQHAAERAAALWSKAAPASVDHPYLLRKHVEPGNARQRGDLLVLLVKSIAGYPRSLQFISPDGTKKLLTGGAKAGNFILVAGSLAAALVLIAEGFATASTVAREFPGAAVLAAVDCGNLEPVARAVRSRYPAAQIVVAADDDRMTPGNPGLTKAREAAAAVGAKLIRPAWPEGAPQSLSDFNDLATWMIENTEAAHA